MIFDKRIRPSEWLLVIACGLALVWINAYICRDLFRNPTAFMNSMQGFWIALAKHARSGWLHSDWWPYWDGGMPFEFTYAPLIPSLVAGGAALGLPYILAFQSVTAIAYCLAPLTLFATAWLLTRRIAWSFAAGLFYSLTAPTQLLAPDAAFSWHGFWDARRLYTVTAWDDTPHLAALALLPLAIVCLLAAFEKRGWRYYVLAAAIIAVMTAASEFGPVDIALSALCLLFVFKPAEWRRHLAITAGIGAFSYALVMPSLSPSIVRAIAAASQEGKGPGFSLGSFTALAMFVAGWIVLWQCLRRWTTDWTLQFFVLFAYLFSSIPLGAAYLHRQFIPQPGRYKFEMEMAVSLLIVFALRPWIARWKRPFQLGLILLLVYFAAQQIIAYRRFAKAMLRPGDMTASIEYRCSIWVQKNLPGTRIMLPGSIAQWANAFDDIVQFSGGSWSRALNPVQQLGLAAVYNGGARPEQDARVSMAWLKAYGVGAVAVSGPRSAEYWKPYGHPAKFEGLLPVLWRQDDVTVYRVPEVAASLAHVVPRNAIVERSPRDGTDIADLELYGSALQDARLPPATLAWNGSNHVLVQSNAGQGQVISVQISYHSGWHASRDGRSIPVLKDGLGFIWLDPHCDGPCEIRMDYGGGWELRLSHYVSVAALGVLIVLAAF